MPNNQTECILGLDPGYGRLGFGVLQRTGRGDLLYDTCGVITTTPKASLAERLVEIAKDLRHLMQKHQPTVVVIEELFFVQNITTGIKVAEVRGVIELIAAEHGAQIIEIKPNEIKSIVTGQGHADKRQMQKMITLLLRLDRTPSPDDAADALAIAWAGESKRRLR